MTRWFLCLFVSFGLTAFAAGFARADEGEDDEGEEAGEVHVKLSDCPKAVQETIKSETEGGKIREIEKETETEKGKVVYEAEFVVKGKVYEISVSEEGKLLGKEREDEEDDDDAEGDDDDDAEEEDGDSDDDK